MKMEEVIKEESYLDFLEENFLSTCSWLAFCTGYRKVKGKWERKEEQRYKTEKVETGCRVRMRVLIGVLQIHVLEAVLIGSVFGLCKCSPTSLL